MEETTKATWNTLVGSELVTTTVPAHLEKNKKRVDFPVDSAFWRKEKNYLSG